MWISFWIKKNYKNACALLTPLATYVAGNEGKALHNGMSIDGWTVELHGTLRSCCLPQMDRVIDEVQADTFNEHRVDVWKDQDVDVLLPEADNNVFLVFTHIMKHFYHGGIGLIQVSDWIWLLWVNGETINAKLLETRLKKAGILSEWRTFATLAVEELGMPAETMPLYVSSYRFRRKSMKILAHIMKTGNFGHNRSREYQKFKSSFLRNLIAFSRITKDDFKLFFVFPINTLRSWSVLFCEGVRIALET